MAMLKDAVLKEELVANTKANGRVEQRPIFVDGKRVTMKIYSLRNAAFGAFEYIVSPRSGIVVQPNQEVELINPRLLSVPKVNSNHYTDSSGNERTNYVAFIERSIIGDGLKLKGGK